MRITGFSLVILLGVLLNACQNDPQNTQSRTDSKPDTLVAVPVFQDTLLISLGAVDFYKVLVDKPNMPIIDMRTAKEYAAGHIYRAINIPSDDPMFMNRLAALTRTQEYAVYCSSGFYSKSVAEQMKNMNFKRIFHLKNGIMQWGESGQALQLN